MNKKLPLIINVRGNSGSGKTHLTRQFMEETGATFPITENDKIIGYINYAKPIKGGNKHARWAVIGKYTNACGGCDTVKTQAEVVKRVQYFIDLGFNVWLEGLIMSTIYGTVGEYSEQFGDRWVFAYLDTPIEECIKRVKARRVKAGKPPEFNEKNTRNRVNSITSSRARCVLEGRTVLDLDYKRAFEQVMNFIRKEKL